MRAATGDARTLVKAAVDRLVGDRPRTVRVLSGAARGVRLPPSLIKIDVEGGERRVLQGAQCVLREHRPAVVCEVHGRESRTTIEPLLPAYDVEPLGTTSAFLALPREERDGRRDRGA